MGLRQQAAADLKAILEDSAAGFGWPVTVTDPTGARLDMVGFTNDVNLTIDPSTGISVAGRSISVALAIASLLAGGLDIPRAVADSASKPWLVEFEDAQGQLLRFKIADTNPDRALGIVVCMLEFWKN